MEGQGDRCPLAGGVPGPGLAPACRAPPRLAPSTPPEVGQPIHLLHLSPKQLIRAPACSGVSGLEVSEVTLGEVDRGADYQDYQDYQDYLYAF